MSKAMEPIRLSPRTEGIIPTTDIEMIETYNLDRDHSSFYNFMPMWLQESYQGGNAERLKVANDIIKAYALKRDSLAYLGSQTFLDKDWGSNYCVEYYSDDGEIVSFLYEEDMVVQVGIYVKQNEVQ